jgi:hypothetical protein
MGQDVLGGTNKSDLDHTFGFILPALRERLILRLLVVGLRNLPKNAPAMRTLGRCEESLVEFAFCILFASELPQ